MTKPAWSGVFPAVTTQFKNDQALDLEATQRHVDVLIQSGCRGLVMLGTVGENTSLAADEKHAVLSAAKEAASGRVPVLSESRSTRRPARPNSPGAARRSASTA